MKKIWYMYTMEYYSAIKVSKILLLASMWMDLEHIKLTEICHLKGEGMTKARWLCIDEKVG